MKPPKGKKWSDCLTVKELIEVLQTLPPNYLVLTEEDGVVHNLIWDNIYLDGNVVEDTVFLG